MSETDQPRRVSDRLAARAGNKAIDGVPKWGWGIIGSALGLAFALVIVAWAINFDAGRLGEMTVENEVKIKSARVAADAANEQSALGTIQSLVTELVRQNGKLIEDSSGALAAAKETQKIAGELIPKVTALEVRVLALEGLPERVADLERRMGSAVAQTQALKNRMDAQARPPPK